MWLGEGGRRGCPCRFLSGRRGGGGGGGGGRMWDRSVGGGGLVRDMG